MKKILVVLTGGTIGSVSLDGVLDTGDGLASRPLDFYKQKYGNTVEFEVISPLVTLSENMNAEKISVILRAIDKNKNRADISGIVVTHGSDTLSYSSNIAGLLFESVKLPIVFVAGNKELSDESGNGLVNFKNAVDFITFADKSGVYVSWSNDHDDNTIYYSTDFCEADNYFDKFSSYDGKQCGRMNGGKITVTDDIEIAYADAEKVDLSLKNKVLLIKPYPGLDYTAFDLSDFSAVVHYLYHSSTACVEGECNSILDFIDRCEQNGVRFFIAPLKKHGEKIYSSLEKILQNSYVEPLYDCSIEKAYAYALLEVNKE